jgi:hypothetical protein
MTFWRSEKNITLRKQNVIWIIAKMSDSIALKLVIPLQGFGELPKNLMCAAVKVPCLPVMLQVYVLFFPVSWPSLTDRMQTRIPRQ